LRAQLQAAHARQLSESERLRATFAEEKNQLHAVLERALAQVEQMHGRCARSAGVNSGGGSAGSALGLLRSGVQRSSNPFVPASGDPEPEAGAPGSPLSRG